MPELSRFLGIVIKMIYMDDEKHHKLHVHAHYGEYRTAVAGRPFDRIAPLA